ncbi:hypothetical protein B0J11DRAFT_519416 [Dendryphion nanum]|uniref:Uncharacterized protein n=1 Tax=Dendryphion nanum TaxID=256645 RepID=A0A9P9EEW2_9PLEO|nr:hypothetical protein B0J11DRAFT_519416 [Dendryphion nanum]
MPAWGRGGAGNIAQQEQLKEQNKNSAEDLEANRSLTSAAAAPATSTPTQPPSEYAHMGRGGSGNWYQPRELEQSGSFQQPVDSTAAPSTNTKPNISTPWHPDTQEMPVARAGRGGAGNFVWKDEEREARKKAEEEKAKERVSEGVERDVEAGLAKPGAVMLGGPKGGRGW